MDMTHRTALPAQRPAKHPAAAVVAGLIAGIMCAAFAGLFPLPAHAQRWQLDYRVHVGGVAVLDARAELTLTEGRYSVQVDAATDGFLGRLFPWETRSLSVGTVRPDGVAPIRHTQSGLLRGSPRTVTLDYGPDGRVRTQVSPPPEEEDRDPVPEDLTRQSRDPLSGVVDMMLAGHGEGCQRTVPIYDGRRRYDMIFTDRGMTMVGESRHSVFSGAARQCRVSHKPIAGYERTPRQPFWQRGGGREERPPVDLWIAPVEGAGPPLPVRLETDSGFGGVVVHLTAVRKTDQTAERPAGPVPSPLR
ncbi:DUF3108 domain-containing protein [Azospirillum brasilense]|uniref:DUF3108 domain-containing protein n=2 Tax=Azospirillum brasilense TaxID=192 RepID=A0A6L3B765_AZOBR|nr:DUF3108 domain-containing protein [Azospirillum brasilense]